MRIKIDLRERSNEEAIGRSKGNLPLLYEGVYETIIRNAKFKTSKSGKHKFIETEFQTIDPLYQGIKVWHAFFMKWDENWARESDSNREMLQQILRTNKKRDDELPLAEDLVGLKAYLYVHLVRKEIYDDENQIKAIINPDDPLEITRSLLERSRFLDAPYWILR